MKLKHNISYPINDELERILTQSNAPKNNYLPKDMQSKSKEMIDILSKLSEDCTEKILCIPEYRINTSRLFELYCYLILGNCYDRRLTYQKNIGDGYPDITVEGEKLFFDAKYKFQYDQQVYCELTDVNRMLNYIMQERDYHGYFIYPDMKLLERPKNIQQIVDDVKLRLNNETAKTEWLSKIGIPFPIRNNTSEHEKA